MELLSILRTRMAHCTTRSCIKEGCALGLRSIPPNSIIILDTDKCKKSPAGQGPLCDYILFYQAGGELTSAALELKGGRLEAKDCTRQIANGAKVIENILASGVYANFLSVVLYQRRTHVSEVKLLKAARIEFRGQKFRIFLGRCGAEFKDILKKYI